MNHLVDWRRGKVDGREVAVLGQRVGCCYLRLEKREVTDRLPPQGNTRAIFAPALSWKKAGKDKENNGGGAIMK